MPDRSSLEVPPAYRGQHELVRLPFHPQELLHRHLLRERPLGGDRAPLRRRDARGGRAVAQTDAARERARSAIRAGQVESTSARGPAPAELLLEWTPPAP